MAISRFSTAASLAVLVAAANPAAARGIDVNAPADLPPSSFKGRQYVDSNGCVFIRAGVGSSTNWVPRVTRGRDHLCGYKPTQTAGEKIEMNDQEPATVQAAAPAVEAPAPKAVVAPAAPVVKQAKVQRKVQPAAQSVASLPASYYSGAQMPAQLAQQVYGSKPRVVAPAPQYAVQTPVLAPVQPMAQPAAPARGMVGGAGFNGYVSPYGPSAPAMPVAAMPQRARVVAPAMAPATSGAAQNYAAHTVDGNFYAAQTVAPQAYAGQGYAGQGAAQSYRMVGGTGYQPVTIVATQTMPAHSACAHNLGGASQYTLSDGRRVLRCGAPVADPVAALNGAGVQGLAVEQANSAYTGRMASPMMTTAAYGAQGYTAAPAYAAVSNNQAYTAAGRYVSGVTGQAVNSYGFLSAEAQASGGYAADDASMEALASRAGQGRAKSARAAVAAPVLQAYPAVPSMYGGTGYAASFMAPAQVAPTGYAPAQVAPAAPARANYVSPYAVVSGYKPAFDDGRLNPMRGPRTYAGNQQMAQVWSEQVPAQMYLYGGQ